ASGAGWSGASSAGIAAGSAASIHARIICGGISILNAGEEAERAGASKISQNRAGEIALRDVSLAIKQEEEKCFVLNDRPADAAAELVSVVVVFADTVEVVDPRVRRKFGIPVDGKDAASELIGSRARCHLNLSGTAAEFGICWCHNYANFIDEIGARIGRGCRADIVAAIADGN